MFPIRQMLNYWLAAGQPCPGADCTHQGLFVRDNGCGGSAVIDCK